MAKFTMSSLLEDTESKYGDMELEVPVREDGELVVDDEGNPKTEVARFRYYLRISKEARKRLGEAYEYISGDKELESESKEDGVAQLTRLLQSTVRSLAVSERDYQLVADTFGDDFVYWTKFMELYDANFSEDDESGESKPSATS